jgi:hypothetical protein
MDIMVDQFERCASAKIFQVLHPTEFISIFS